MIHEPQHTLTALEVLPQLGLRLTFADGATLSIDLAPTIRTHRALAALADPALFAAARMDSRGGYVVWIEEDLEMAADNLRNLAIEQAGGIGHERLAIWMAEHGLTQERAADAIGISRRMLNCYLAGSRPIPKTVWLACLGWAAERKERLAVA
jgi:hypothetical protein